MKRLFLLPALLLSASALRAETAVAKPDATSFALCSACHAADGNGLPVGAMKMAAPLPGSAIVKGDPELLGLVILKGIAKEDAKFLGVMAPLEAAYDDAKLAAVMTYVRDQFGDKASAVTTEQAAAIRAKFKDIKTPITRAKLAELAAAKK